MQNSEEIKDYVFQLIEENRKIGLKDLYEQVENEFSGKLTTEDKKVIKSFRNEKLEIKQLSYPNSIKGYTNELQDLIKNVEGLDSDDEKCIIRLTLNNSEKIEKEISNDLSYYPFARRIYERFKEIIQNYPEDQKLRPVFALIREIDRDNSTNVWRYKRNQKYLLAAEEYISDSHNNFFNDLKDGVKDLPDKICTYALKKSPPANDSNNPLKSLSSKICKYLYEYMFENDNQNMYYINDKYVRNILPYYLDFYFKTEEKEQLKIKLKEDDISNIESAIDFYKLSYKQLDSILENLRHKAGISEGCELTKSQLDHILWYCYKSYTANY